MRALIALGAMAALVACNTRPPTAPLGIDAGPPPVCTGPGITCIRDAAWTCGESGPLGTPRDCAAEGLTCVETVGCLACSPGTVRCEGETVQVCSPDGSAWASGETCDPSAGERCSPDGCMDLCARAAEESSYIGCSYWPVTTTNSELAPDFAFALAIANPNLVPALVTVSRGGAEVATRSVAPGALEVIELEVVEPLFRARSATVRLSEGAYHLVSDVPVVVSQFNPLEYRIETDCAEPADPIRDRRCHSYTNDASLLLPESVLSASYVVVSRPTFRVSIDDAPLSGGGGFVAIVGVDEVPMPIEIQASAHIAASADGSFAAMAPGETRSVTLARGEVLELVSATPEGCPGELRTEMVAGQRFSYCDLGPAYNLTGTQIRGNGRVAVISGHDCTFVPFDRWACDHLEEQIFPVESLGSSVIVPEAVSIRGEPSLVRIVSAADANTITLEPGGETFELALGEHREIVLESATRISGTGAILVAQFLVGQDYGGLGTGRSGSGDPALGLAIPEAQFRRSYAVLTPSSYEQSWVGVVAPTGLRVVIDEGVVDGWEEIEGTGYSRARVRVEGGVHRLDATVPFGVTVYGFGRYTSYMVSGGLDLRRISPPI